LEGDCDRLEIIEVIYLDAQYGSSGFVFLVSMFGPGEIPGSVGHYSRQLLTLIRKDIVDVQSLWMLPEMIILPIL
jgi:hypothetical protein